ncbi:MAG: succinylglutamate desuccinylase/aspartoacylase family protein [Ignavibacteriales bacterium]|nr:succinylglutamate desuccinylase/aspartoacylase family protein [Ignavibacteriales bacterium]
MQRHHYSAVVLLSVGLIVSGIASADFLSMYKADALHPSASLTKSGMLSDYVPALKGTNGDTRVYYYESGNPGATILLLGGTHPNESAGFIAATVLVENAHVAKGRLIVVPQACASGFTVTDPLEGCPTHFTVAAQSGPRTFRFGARGGNPLHQWPDPLVYRHFPSGQQLSGMESRNLNRSYPGRENGSFMEKVGYAFVQMIKKEKVDIAFDLHEAAPEVMIINAIITHEKGSDIGASAVLNLEFEDLKYSLEISPKNFHGLSHREWGDSTDVVPFLMETSNPIQGRMRGITNEKLILEGQDPFYRIAAQLGTVRITYELDGEPLSLRVARHLQGFRRVVEAYNEAHPEKTAIVENVPEYLSVVKQGVGNFLR